MDEEKKNSDLAKAMLANGLDGDTWFTTLRPENKKSNNTEIRDILKMYGIQDPTQQQSCLEIPKKEKRKKSKKDKNK